MNKKEPKDKPSHTLMSRMDLPTVFCDKVFLSIREEDTQVPYYVMSWAQKAMNVKNQYVEQSRIMVTEEHFKKILDAFCKTVNYFPKKEDEKIKDIKTVSK